MLIEKLHLHQQNNLHRTRPLRKLNDGACDFISSDYLALSKHPKIIAAYQDAISHYGFGSLASPVVSGYYTCHRALEEKISEILNTEKTLLFNAGYLANLAALSCILDEKQIVIADKQSHISLLQGIKLSGAKLHRYHHNDLIHLNKLVAKYQPNLIISQTVFSMDGDKGDIRTIASSHDTRILIDDAHGFGWLETKAPKNTLFTLSLSKTLAAMGGAISGSVHDIEYILQFGKAYQYSTGISPVVATGVLATLNITQEESWRKQKLIENISLFNDLAMQLELPLVSTDITPIRAIVIQDIEKTLLLQRQLQEQGFLVSAIRPPSVAPSSSRLRITVNSAHTENDIKILLAKLSEFYHAK